MDYKAIYYKIIEKAKKETENGNRHVGYYEKHHIQPKALGGSNKKENLVRLTAREHFICHWLLVKMYDKGTTERNKMLCALWRMNHNGSKNHGVHYINSHAYEALRIEFAKSVGERTSIAQQGNKNSRFGTKWYTNRNTGESKSFKKKPLEDFWIEGRNLFHGEYSSLKRNMNTRNKEKRLIDAKKIWNDFHNGEYLSIRDYCRKTNKSLRSVMYHLTKIPAYSKVFIGRSHNNGSKKEFVNVFEV